MGVEIRKLAKEHGRNLKLPGIIDVELEKRVSRVGVLDIPFGKLDTKMFKAGDSLKEKHCCKGKNSKSKENSTGTTTRKQLPVSRFRILRALEAAWNSAPRVRVVFNKGSTKIEWKVFVKVDGHPMGLSIQKNGGQWQLQDVVDRDAYRLWGQYQLLRSLPN